MIFPETTNLARAETSRNQSVVLGQIGKLPTQTLFLFLTNHSRLAATFDKHGLFLS